MDIYAELKKDHQEVKSLLSQLVAASEVNEDTKKLLTRISAELIPHARAEEAVFYNSLRLTDSAKSEVMHGYKEHMEAETILRTLQGLSAIGIEWTGAVKKLQEAIEHHITEEEGKIFEIARKLLLDEEAQQLGRAFVQMKAEAKEQGALKNTMDMVANLMPKRFVDSFRSQKSVR